MLSMDSSVASHNDNQERNVVEDPIQVEELSSSEKPFCMDSNVRNVQQSVNKGNIKDATLENYGIHDLETCDAAEDGKMSGTDVDRIDELIADKISEFSSAGGSLGEFHQAVQSSSNNTRKCGLSTMRLCSPFLLALKDLSCGYHTSLCENDCRYKHHPLTLVVGLTRHRRQVLHQRPLKMSRMQCVRSLIESGWDCNSVIPDECPLFQLPLIHLACMFGRSKDLKAFIEFGLDNCVTTCTGRTAVHIMQCYLYKALCCHKNSHKTECFRACLNILTAANPRILLICEKTSKNTALHLAALHMQELCHQEKEITLKIKNSRDSESLTGEIRYYMKERWSPLLKEREFHEANFRILVNRFNELGWQLALSKAEAASLLESSNIHGLTILQVLEDEERLKAQLKELREQWSLSSEDKEKEKRDLPKSSMEPLPEHTSLCRMNCNSRHHPLTLIAAHVHSPEDLAARLQAITDDLSDASFEVPDPFPPFNRPLVHLACILVNVGMLKYVLKELRHSPIVYSSKIGQTPLTLLMTMLDWAFTNNPNASDDGVFCRIIDALLDADIEVLFAQDHGLKRSAVHIILKKMLSSTTRKVRLLYCSIVCHLLKRIKEMHDDGVISTKRVNDIFTARENNEFTIISVIKGHIDNKTLPLKIVQSLSPFNPLPGTTDKWFDESEYRQIDGLAKSLICPLGPPTSTSQTQPSTSNSTATTWPPATSTLLQSASSTATSSNSTSTATSMSVKSRSPIASSTVQQPSTSTRNKEHPKSGQSKSKGRSKYSQSKSNGSISDKGTNTPSMFSKSKSDGGISNILLTMGSKKSTRKRHVSDNKDKDYVPPVYAIWPLATEVARGRVTRQTVIKDIKSSKSGSKRGAKSGVNNFDTDEEDIFFDSPNTKSEVTDEAPRKAITNRKLSHNHLNKLAKKSQDKNEEKSEKPVNSLKKPTARKSTKRVTFQDDISTSHAEPAESPPIKRLKAEPSGQFSLCAAAATVADSVIDLPKLEKPEGPSLLEVIPSCIAPIGLPAVTSSTMKVEPPQLSTSHVSSTCSIVTASSSSTEEPPSPSSRKQIVKSEQEQPMLPDTVMSDKETKVKTQIDIIHINSLNPQTRNKIIQVLKEEAQTERQTKSNRLQELWKEKASQSGKLVKLRCEEKEQEQQLGKTRENISNSKLLIARLATEEDELKVSIDKLERRLLELETI
ncbi:uncharacterized protein LOC5513704 [Nematostella vectensis]|uniref:uncharacterized protein LOC5513704 n=1 Tax=Nematostella vectensis TaxID=45351 RepID=UPI002076EF8C|nr:uncharacterized protein LOC5513704 [Nematostella vectensis]